MTEIKLVAVIILLIQRVSSQGPLTNHLIADKDGKYHIFWEANEDIITFELQVETKGYVGFGFSPNGGMPGSDAIIAWVYPNGTSVFHDRHATAFAEPDIDKQQNYQLISASENATHTIIRFSRKINTCDKEQDNIITDDTITVIYSWHPEDPPASTGLKPHGPNRGARQIFLLSPQPPPYKITDDIVIWDMQMPNVSIPEQETTYWCVTMKLPELDGPHDYIGYTIGITPGNEEHIHHFTVRQCLGDNPLFEQRANDKKGYQCITAGTIAEPIECQPPIALWTVGSVGQTLPENLGVPVGVKYGGASYFHISMHYTNKALKAGILDSTTLRMYLTKKPRPVRAQMLNLYNFHDYTLVLPPKLPQITVTAFCTPECTQSTFPPEGIKVFAVGFHTHLKGRKLTLRHFRGNEELKPIASDDHYDFSYQNMRQLKDHVTVLPGDVLMGTCYYSTEGLDKTLTGGYSTYEEMCFLYLYYYPSTTLTICIGGPDYKVIYDYFGVEAVGQDKMHVVAPAALQNQTMIKVIQDYDWAAAGEAKLKQMLDIQSEGTKIVTCQHQPGSTIKDSTNKIAYPKNATFYVDKNDVCTAKSPFSQSTKSGPEDYNPTTKAPKRNGAYARKTTKTY